MSTGEVIQEKQKIEGVVKAPETADQLKDFSKDFEKELTKPEGLEKIYNFSKCLEQWQAALDEQLASGKISTEEWALDQIWLNATRDSLDDCLKKNDINNQIIKQLKKLDNGEKNINIDEKSIEPKLTLNEQQKLTLTYTMTTTWGDYNTVSVMVDAVWNLYPEQNNIIINWTYYLLNFDENNNLKLKKNPNGKLNELQNYGLILTPGINIDNKYVTKTDNGYEITVTINKGEKKEDVKFILDANWEFIPDILNKTGSTLDGESEAWTWLDKGAYELSINKANKNFTLINRAATTVVPTPEELANAKLLAEKEEKKQKVIENSKVNVLEKSKEVYKDKKDVIKYNTETWSATFNTITEALKTNQNDPFWEIKEPLITALNTGDLKAFQKLIYPANKQNKTTIDGKLWPDTKEQLEKYLLENIKKIPEYADMNSVEISTFGMNCLNAQKNKWISLYWNGEKYEWDYFNWDRSWKWVNSWLNGDKYDGNFENSGWNWIWTFTTWNREYTWTWETNILVNWENQYTPDQLKKDTDGSILAKLNGGEQPKANTQKDIAVDSVAKPEFVGSNWSDKITLLSSNAPSNNIGEGDFIPNKENGYTIPSNVKSLDLSELSSLSADNLKAIQNLPQLTSLKLNGLTTLDEATATVLSRLNNLTKLDLNGLQILDKDPGNILASSTLEFLSLNWLKKLDMGCLVMNIPAWTNENKQGIAWYVKTIPRIDLNWLTNLTPEVATEFSKTNNLELLSLDSLNLNTLENIKSLKILMDGNKKTNILENIETLEPNMASMIWSSNLDAVSLPKITQLTPQLASYLVYGKDNTIPAPEVKKSLFKKQTEVIKEEFKPNEKMKTLDLSWLTTLDAATAKILADLPNLETLDLRWLTTLNVDTAKELAKSPKLREIDLSWLTTLDTSTATELANLANIEILKLGWLTTLDAATAINFSKLISLDVNGLTTLDAATANVLANDLPDLKELILNWLTTLDTATVAELAKLHALDVLDLRLSPTNLDALKLNLLNVWFLGLELEGDATDDQITNLIKTLNDNENIKSVSININKSEDVLAGLNWTGNSKISFI